MMKRLLCGFGGIVFAALIIIISYFACVMLQPTDVSIHTLEEEKMSNYITPSSIYYLKGSMECYPGVALIPLDISSYSGTKTIITDLSEVRQSACRVDNSYIATLRFFVKVPAGTDYAFEMPGVFCEYMIYVNGVITASTDTFRTDNPSYPSKKVIEIPASSNTEYEIVILAVTPVNSLPSTSSTIIFGASDRIAKLSANSLKSITVISAIILVSIIFTAIQFLAIKRERMLTSYILLSLAVLIRLLFSGDLAITLFVKNIPYKTGTILMSITMPLIILSVVYHAYCLYPSLFPQTGTRIICGLQIFSLLNVLTLRSILALKVLSFIAYALAFSLCYYVVIKAYSRKYSNSVLFSLGLILFSIEGTLTILSSTLPVPLHYPEFYPFAMFTIVEIIILAKRYTDQESAEQFYNQELTKRLEKMQDSENAFLNAQMKPHFLYNTLNTIADLCVADPDKAQSLIKTLSDYLKLILSIDNMEKTVPLSQEMELASSYTAIEKERFPSINFYTDFPVRMPRINMPPLTLQPLIENAIKHGVRKSDRPGAITLRIRESSDSVTFYVSDNGVGMNEATINRLFEQPKENKSIGVYNIDKRLKNLYHTGLEVDSTEGLGTCISFTIPK